MGVGERRNAATGVSKTDAGWQSRKTGIAGDPKRHGCIPGVTLAGAPRKPSLRLGFLGPAPPFRSRLRYAQ